jgi:hypothetical protein
MDPDEDPGGPKTYGSYGSGSAILKERGGHLKRAYVILGIKLKVKGRVKVTKMFAALKF